MVPGWRVCACCELVAGCVLAVCRCVMCGACRVAVRRRAASAALVLLVCLNCPMSGVCWCVIMDDKCGALSVGCCVFVEGGRMMVADRCWWLAMSYWLVVVCLGYLFFYAVIGSKNINRNIPVE